MHISFKIYLKLNSFVRNYLAEQERLFDGKLSCRVRMVP
jgi:hypothetical protein